MWYSPKFASRMGSARASGVQRVDDDGFAGSVVRAENALAFLVVGHRFAEELEAVAVRVGEVDTDAYLVVRGFHHRDALFQEHAVQAAQILEVTVDLQSVVLQPDA